MVRRLLAAALAMLLLLGVSGAARALGGESVECCCGRHDAHRACKCPACPVSKKRKQTGSRVDIARDCDGNSDPGVLVVTAVAPPAPSLPALAAADVPVVEIQSLSSRLVEAGRPPP
jgi:hypothetical protein